MELFPERLKSLRKEKNLTQKQTALIFNLTERGYQNYELGQSRPNVQLLSKIAGFFDVSIDYLLGNSDQHKQFVYNFEKSEELIGLYLHGIEVWSENPFFDARETQHIKGHLAELLIRYKNLINKVCDLKMHQLSSKEPFDVEYYKKNSTRELDNLKGWLENLPDYFFGNYRD